MLEAFVIVAVVFAVLAGVVFYLGPETFLAKVFGTKHDREVKSLHPIIEAINAMEPRMLELSDAELESIRQYLRSRAMDLATDKPTPGG